MNNASNESVMITSLLGLLKYRSIKTHKTRLAEAAAQIPFDFRSVQR